MSDRDLFWMQRAIQLAKEAEKQGEVPVGAVLVCNDEIVSEGYNRPIFHHDPTAHAEVVALRAAAEKMKNYRLPTTTLYVTLEPCMMCAGAMVHARVNQLVYGAYDGKAGAVQSMAQVLDKPFLNHRVSHRGGVMAAECGVLLSEFFKKRRE